MLKLCQGLCVPGQEVVIWHVAVGGWERESEEAGGKAEAKFSSFMLWDQDNFF